MTPEEILALELKQTKRIEGLRTFKNTIGYEMLMEIVRDQFTACVRAKLQDTKPELQAQIDADMRAWNSIGSLIDFEIGSYDVMVQQRLQQQQQGGYNAH